MPGEIKKNKLKPKTNMAKKKRYNKLLFAIRNEWTRASGYATVGAIA